MADGLNTAVVSVTLSATLLWVIHRKLICISWSEYTVLEKERYSNFRCFVFTIDVFKAKWSSLLSFGVLFPGIKLWSRPARWSRQPSNYSKSLESISAHLNQLVRSEEAAVTLAQRSSELLTEWAEVLKHPGACFRFVTLEINSEL